MNAVTEIKAETAVPHVLLAVNSIMTSLAALGIAKDRHNKSQNYDFRGIDDVYNVLCQLLAENSLIITPKCLSHSREFVPTGKGGQAVSAVVMVEYTFKSALDGSTEIVGPFPGEAMDYGDKATNKAMSAAYKYMAMQEFCIPTKGDNDADASTHQLASAEEMAINLLRGASADRGLFKEAWEKNKAGWKRVLDGPAYARVVAEMKRLAEAFPKDEPATQTAREPEARSAPADDFGIGDDEIPF